MFRKLLRAMSLGIYLKVKITPENEKKKNKYKNILLRYNI